MKTENITPESRARLIEIMKAEVDSAPGRKVLEYGSAGCSLAPDLRDSLEYLACTDKSADFPEKIRHEAEKRDIFLIPDEELGEDCYFGRFHLVYTNFGFSGKSHLVDEIMKLRRLIIKGGKIVIIDSAADGFESECLRQLKRCGFEGSLTGSLEIDGEAVFVITAQK